MGTTASLQPASQSLYEARNEYDSAKRMYDAVRANNPSVEMEQLYQYRLEMARSSYTSSIQSYATAAGATVLAVGAAVLVCSPGMLLPTP